jgi:ABC-type branched-subunit amino acid transport system ATPase component
LKRELAATSASVGGTGQAPAEALSHAADVAPVMPVNDHVTAGARAGRAAAAASREDALELWGLVAGYADTEVLHGIDLRVPKGSIVAVLGPNGTGKSTMCGAIAGTVHVSAGQVLLDGEDVTATPAYRRTGKGLMLAPESRGIFPTLSVEENLSVSLALNADRQRAFDRFPQLAARAKLPAASLSGGEQQMLCLAPLLVRPPRVLLADEITLGLAPAIVEQILVHLRELREAGVTILMVEEKARNVLGLADYCAFLSLGKVTAWGPMSEFTEEILAESYLGTATAADITAHEDVPQ